MKISIKGLFAAGALALPCAPPHAAELFYMDHDRLTTQYVGAVGPLVISGEIDPGDYERLLAKIAADRNRFMSANKLILASNGGDVAEAIKIARFAASLYIMVSVGPQTGPCVGACFLIYAAAAERATDGGRLIGLHRPALEESVSARLSPADAEALEHQALARVREFLDANAVPETLVGEMFRRAADDVYWLSPQDEAMLGNKSPAFRSLLAQKCGWSQGLEREVYSGRRPFKDLSDMLACRQRVVAPLARQRLAAALTAAR